MAAPVESEIHALKENLLDMIDLVENQLTHCREVIKKKDVDLAERIIETEKKINAQELAIDKDCENIIALHNPMATDLRFVLATIKISNDLERIADNASSFAKFLKKHVKNVNEDFFHQFHIDKMLDVCIVMMKDMHEALKKENTKLVRKVFSKDEALNEINKRSVKIASSLLKEYPDDHAIILRLFSIVRNLERVGDLTKNIGEEIVFHIEARVLKHQKKI
ncbi:phosphate signaling complex protein PhoU [Chryseolinea sp. H1M3-3]|jgi:phosphate transport system protein|uniref:phosphate signaling complex protein PhoU n=1 Tax=Chryseolinea sp. H1M3-3 TaxID=3034144 RepID=UPI0023ECB938|nr:phosphate signaling complex protein PhoU [Chryseolinea sp. H1M3-3]